MLPLNHRQHLICAVLCFVAAGCYGHGLHGPYGGQFPQNGSFSGTQFGQPQFLNQPGVQQFPGSYTVPGGVVLPPSSSQPYTPGGEIPGSNLTPLDGWQPLNEPSNGLGNDGFGSGTTGSGYVPETSNGLVPRPRDEMFEANESGFDSTEPFGRVGSSRIDVTASAFSQPRVNTQVAASKYGFSGQDYSWLRGILSRDTDDPSALNITYSIAGTDEHLGNFVLVPDQRLRQFRIGDIVEVEGRIDRQSVSGLGKPKYRISSIRPLSAQ